MLLPKRRMWAFGVDSGDIAAQCVLYFEQMRTAGIEPRTIVFEAEVNPHDIAAGLRAVPIRNWPRTDHALSGRVRLPVAAGASSASRYCFGGVQTLGDWRAF